MTHTPNTVDKVRAMMTRNQLNQSQMARLLGVPQGTIGNWLGGTRQPNQVVTRFVAVLEEAELFHQTLFKRLLVQALKPAA